MKGIKIMQLLNYPILAYITKMKIFLFIIHNVLKDMMESVY